MAEMKLLYTGDGPGQAEKIRIGAAVYCRCETYTVTDGQAKSLLRKGGFTVVKSKKKESKK